MKINRAVVKQQAQSIIKGNVFKLFLISLVVGILAGGTMSFDTSDFDDVKSYFNGDKNAFSDSYEQNENGDPFNFDEFTTDYNENFFDEFDGNGKIALNTAFAGLGGGIFTGLMAGLGFFMIAKRLFLGPLNVMLNGLYWQLIRGNNMSLSDGFGYVFKKTFDKNYMQKFLLQLVQGILLGLLYCLFIIPGIIFSYKWYFTGYIMAENPELTFEQAMNLSKKMTNNHKGELFVMDLSFIPWYLLMIPTLGLASIYVTPYVSTTHALYYENFKARAFQEGAITQFDFMSNSQKVELTAQQMNNGYYAPVQQENPYYTPAPQAAVEQTTTYYTPATPEAPAAPMPTAEQYYQPAPQPVAEPVPTPEPVQPEAAPEVAQPEIFEAPAEAPSEDDYTPTEPPQSTEE